MQYFLIIVITGRGNTTSQRGFIKPSSLIHFVSQQCPQHSDRTAQVWDGTWGGSSVKERLSLAGKATTSAVVGIVTPAAFSSLAKHHNLCAKSEDIKPG